MKEHNEKMVEDRFWTKVEKTDGCWMWLACKDKDGYGAFSAKGVSWKAHRFAYLLSGKEIPVGMTLDHLCRNRACVNPAHLEPVTNKENLLRGNGLGAVNAKKTHCPQGHPYEGSNLVFRYGWRVCKICRREQGKKKKQSAPLPAEACTEVGT